MKVDPGSVRLGDVRVVYIRRVHQIIERHRRGKPLAPIKVTRNGVLIAGEHELTAAQIMQLPQIDAMVVKAARPKGGRTT